MSDKKITLYYMVEKKGPSRKIANQSAEELLEDTQQKREGEYKTVPLYSSFFGSLVDVSKKYDMHHPVWARLVLKARQDDVVYPNFRFPDGAEITFLLLERYKDELNKALKTSPNSPIYHETDEIFGKITGIHFLYNQQQGASRFSFYYHTPDDSTYLSHSHILQEENGLLNQVVNWFMTENESFRNHYNKILQHMAMRQPIELVDLSKQSIVSVINPATTPIICTDVSCLPQLTHITRINSALLPKKEEYNKYLMADLVTPRAFNSLKSAQGRVIAGWANVFKEAPVKASPEGMRFNAYKSRVSLWKRLLGLSKQAGKQKSS